MFEMLDYTISQERRADMIREAELTRKARMAEFSRRAQRKASGRGDWSMTLISGVRRFYDFVLSLLNPSRRGLHTGGSAGGTR